MDQLKAALPSLPAGARGAYLTTINVAMDMAAGDADRVVLGLRSALAQAEMWAHDERMKAKGRRG